MTARRRLRRRLLVFSAPVALLLVVVIVKSLSMVIAGDSAASAYAERDNGGLRQAVDSLTVLNVVEPEKAYFAAGALAVLDNRLEEADRQFSESLARTQPADSCAVRVNLQLVRETLGDRAAAVLDGRTAVAQYISARTVVEQAPPGCFAGNTDADPQRQVLRTGRTASTSAAAGCADCTAATGATRRVLRADRRATAPRTRYAYGTTAADTSRRRGPNR